MLRFIRYTGAALVGLAGLASVAWILLHHRVVATARGTIDEWVVRDVAYLEWWALATAVGGAGLGGALAVAIARRSRAAWLAAAPFLAAWTIGFAGRAVEYGDSPLAPLAGLAVGLFVLVYGAAWARDRGLFVERAEP
ncbi:MAG TPA: hypothetical protein RMH99_17295 [Sandaracinaceae bacterium LLY-WYZ-13_1]|nr:hypothetical protein [Sandaracinaceae bacterium LLY-WYZ-13_1]